MKIAKRFIALVLACLIFGSTAVWADDEGELDFSDPIPGDVNLNGVIRNDDLILTARHVVHIVTLKGEQLKAADINTDGTVNNQDIITTARVIVGIEG